MKKLDLPGYKIEEITLENMEKYETIFYSNKDYYLITDGHPATKEDCIDTIEYCLDGFPKENILNIGISYNEEAVAGLFALEGYPTENVFWIGLFLVDEKYKRKAIGTKIINALVKEVGKSSINTIQLSVQDNNVPGLAFWKKLGFSVIDRCDEKDFQQLTMEYKIG